MDTMKDTKMQPATDAGIEELRMLAEDLYVNGYNRYSSAMSKAADELEQLRARVERMEKVIDALGSGLNAVAKERDDVAQQLVQSERGKRAISEECDALRNEIAYVKEVEFPRKAQAVADAWKGKCKRLEVERDILRAKIAEMEKQVPICRAEDLKHAESLLPTLGLKPENPLYALPGAKGE